MKSCCNCHCQSAFYKRQRLRTNAADGGNSSKDCEGGYDDGDDVGAGTFWLLVMLVLVALVALRAMCAMRAMMVMKEPRKAPLWAPESNICELETNLTAERGM
ncbi:hypothetical protein AK812_SmicGene7413 [Symbiodinium microadriaticum]|uniref:Uncharacterized protein n=1 Tax=Symbiodinium microadriaticum TaxID=2951 RepID=A0A1Q9ENK5_SYMMI|nr:hypothetical protein AK812_SmicGene7413 [Symbiodinium microadriaticum]